MDISGHTWGNSVNSDELVHTGTRGARLTASVPAFGGRAGDCQAAPRAAPIDVHPQSTGPTTVTTELISTTKDRKETLVKFRCERDSLVEVLTTAGRAVSSRTSTSMALGGVRIESVGNHLTVVGTDLDLTVHASTEAIGLDDGVCVAPAQLLADIVRSLEPGAVTFERRARRSRSVRPDRGSACGPSRWTTSPCCPNPRGRPRSCRRPLARRCARWCGPRPTTTPGRCSPGCSSRPKEAGSAWWPPTPTVWPCGTSTGATRCADTLADPGAGPGAGRAAEAVGAGDEPQGRRSSATADGRTAVPSSVCPSGTTT